MSINYQIISLNRWLDRVDILHKIYSPVFIKNCLCVEYIKEAFLYYS